MKAFTRLSGILMFLASVNLFAGKSLYKNMNFDTKTYFSDDFQASEDRPFPYIHMPGPKGALFVYQINGDDTQDLFSTCNQKLSGPLECQCLFALNYKKFLKTVGVSTEIKEMTLYDQFGGYNGGVAHELHILDSWNEYSDQVSIYWNAPARKVKLPRVSTGPNCSAFKF